MARGLSDLQKQILKMAYEGHESESIEPIACCIDVHQRYDDQPVEELENELREHFPEYDIETWREDSLEEYLGVVLWGVYLKTNSYNETETLAEKVKALGYRCHVENIKSAAAIYTYDILGEVYGFAEYPISYRGGSGEYKKRFPWGLHFDRASIGEERYNAAQAAVSKALKRLEDRGLLVRLYVRGYGAWTGATLTEPGMQAARELLANKTYNCN